MKSTNARVVVSGSTWMGSGIGSINTALHRLFEQAHDEVMIVSYSISGATSLVNSDLEALLQRAIRIRILINRLQDQHIQVRNQLQQLKQTYPTLLEVRSFEPPHEQTDLHAKVLVVDRHYALVGSANLSLRGLFHNHELGIVLEGASVTEMMAAIEIIWASPHTRNR